MDGPALGRLLALHADIFKIAAVPDRPQIALQRGFVVNVTNAGINTGFNRLRGNAAVGGDVSFRNELARLRRGIDLWNQSKEQQTKDQRQGPDPRDMLRTGFLN